MNNTGQSVSRWGGIYRRVHGSSWESLLVWSEGEMGHKRAKDESVEEEPRYVYVTAGGASARSRSTRPLRDVRRSTKILLILP